MEPLKVKTVSVEANLKFFSKEHGESGGSSCMVTFEVPDGTTSTDLPKLILREKWRLDKVVLLAEYCRGVISVDQVKERTAALKKAYESLLKETETGESTNAHQA